MPQKFRLLTTGRFERQAIKLPAAIYQQLTRRLQLLETNPRHPSLQTHEVKHAAGDYAGKIFEAYINKQYRFTWEYGPGSGEITLRNTDNHDDCLKKP
ncbi:MAG: hypothetical protein HYT79_03620 [Elusimicrobia bacterium]|nr:hypothetical protein [Elusimicrobiota bacterium]